MLLPDLRTESEEELHVLRVLGTQGSFACGGKGIAVRFLQLPVGSVLSAQGLPPGSLCYFHRAG